MTDTTKQEMTGRWRWPRGKYNRQRIVGVRLQVRVDVTDWGLRWFGRYGTCARIGPARIWVEAEYEQLWGAEKESLSCLIRKDLRIGRRMESDTGPRF